MGVYSYDIHHHIKLHPKTHALIVDMFRKKMTFGDAMHQLAEHDDIAVERVTRMFIRFCGEERLLKRIDCGYMSDRLPLVIDAWRVCWAAIQVEDGQPYRNEWNKWKEISLFLEECGAL